MPVALAGLLCRATPMVLVGNLWTDVGATDVRDGWLSGVS
jgi:hypothetical protein